MQPRSSSSAGATYLDKAGRIRELVDAAHRAAELDSSIRRVVLFGSMVSGIPTPRSDADLLIVVETSAHAAPRDRVPGMLGALAPLPCPVDLFVVTVEELERPGREKSPMLREALGTGMDLL